MAQLTSDCGNCARYREIVNEFKAEDKAEREAERERRAAEREANKKKSAQKSRRASEKKTDEEALEEIQDELDELDNGGDEYDGDPQDRKALLQHTKSVKLRRRFLIERKQRLEHALVLKERKDGQLKQRQAAKRNERAKVSSQACLLFVCAFVLRALPPERRRDDCFLHCTVAATDGRQEQNQSVAHRGGPFQPQLLVPRPGRRCSSRRCFN